MTTVLFLVVVEDVCRKFSVLGDTPVAVVVVASSLVVDWQ